MLLAVRTSSYGSTWEVWRALKKLKLLSAAPRATLTLLSCSPNFPRASITRCTHAKHEPILKSNIMTDNFRTRLRKFKTSERQMYKDERGFLFTLRNVRNQMAEKMADFTLRERKVLWL